MALIICPECGKEMSDLAESCLNCGYPISNYLDKQKKLDKLNQEYEEKIREIDSVTISNKPTILQSAGAISYILLLLLGCSVTAAIKFANSPTYYYLVDGKAYPVFNLCIAFSALSAILFIALVIATVLTRKRNIKKYIKNEEKKKQLRKELIIRQYEEYKNNLSKYGVWEETDEMNSKRIQSNILSAVITIKNCVQFFVVLTVIGLFAAFIMVIMMFM